LVAALLAMSDEAPVAAMLKPMKTALTEETARRSVPFVHLKKRRTRTATIDINDQL
jgi:hypothetical protein